MSIHAVVHSEQALPNGFQKQAPMQAPAHEIEQAATQPSLMPRVGPPKPPVRPGLAIIGRRSCGTKATLAAADLPLPDVA